MESLLGICAQVAARTEPGAASLQWAPADQRRSVDRRQSQQGSAPIMPIDPADMSLSQLVAAAG